VLAAAAALAVGTLADPAVASAERSWDIGKYDERLGRLMDNEVAHGRDPADIIFDIDAVCASCPKECGTPAL